MRDLLRRLWRILDTPVCPWCRHPIRELPADHDRNCWARYGA